MVSRQKMVSRQTQSHAYPQAVLPESVNSPLVSGIIIFLNEETFLEESIASVFAQTYDNWELLLVDDGSTDRSTAIAQLYAQQYPAKVRYLEHEHHLNRGMSASRNLGIRNARGTYIALLDADDIWLPQKLECQVQILESQPAAVMVYGRTQFWHSWTGDPEKQNWDSFTDLGIQPNVLVSPPSLLTLFLQDEKTVASTCSSLIRRSVFDQLEFEESFRNQYEDMVFYTKLFSQYPVYVAHGCWDRYRQHAGNSWIDTDDNELLDPENLNSPRITFLNWIETYLAQQGFKKTAVWTALQTVLWPYRHHPLLKRQAQLQQLGWKIREPLVQGLKQLPLVKHILPWLKSWSKSWLKPKPPVLPLEWLDPMRSHLLSTQIATSTSLWGISRDDFATESFLLQHVQDIHGRVLEIHAEECRKVYVHRFGGDRISHSLILPVVTPHPSHPNTHPNTHSNTKQRLEAEAFDCILVPEVLPFVMNVPQVLETLYHSLKPRGVLLVMFASPQHFPQTDADLLNSPLPLNSIHCQKIFERIFPPDHLTIETIDNRLIAIRAVKPEVSE